MNQKRLAIVEDCEGDLTQLIQCLERYEQERHVELRIRSFRSGIELLEDYQPEYDLIFMDIEMPHLNGMETAKKLREADEQVALIFVTRMAQYALKGYEVSALDYIVKPVQYAALSEKLALAFRRLERQSANQRFLYLETGADAFRRLAFDDIYYITKHLNYIVYATREGELRVRGTLKDVEKSFEGSSIVKCAKGLMVNLCHVEQKVHNMVTVCGLQFTVTKPYEDTFTRAFMNYLKGGR